MSTHWLHFAVAAAMASAAPGAFAKNALNDTGMLNCLSSGGQLTTSCANTGQDGEFGRDITQPRADNGKAGFAFERMCNSGELAGQGACPATPALGTQPNDWGCTFDKVTRLLWEVKTADGGLRDYRKVYTDYGDKRAGDVSRYPAAVNKTGLCGRKNWHLPTPADLLTIVDHGAIAPAPLIDLQWFPNTVGNASWTGVGQVNIEEQAWAVNFSWGSVGPAQRHFQLGARLVSKAISPTASRFTANGDEVIDNRTGLVWRRCSEGQTWDGSTCVGTATAFNGWHGALARARSEAQRTGQGWRMPNAKEHFSIVDPAHAQPAIDPVFPNTPGDYCSWTSTPESSLTDDTMPWSVRCIAFNEGGLYATSFMDEGNPRWLRLVRNAK